MRKAFQQIQRIFTEFPFYPLLFTTYAILYPLSVNLEELLPADAFRSLLIGLLATILACLAARLILRDWNRAALITTWGLLLFFSFGHIFQLLKADLGSSLLIRFRYFFILWGLLFLVGLYLVSRIHGPILRLNQILNLVLVIFVGLVVYQISAYTYTQYRNSLNKNQITLRDLNARGIHSVASQLNPPAKADLPDVYYISLESYSRLDTLMSVYHFDNSPFEDFLKSKGFLIADCARSNFPRTPISVATTLNMNYLQTFSQDLWAENKSYSDTYNRFILNSTVRQTFEDLGYTIVSSRTGWKMVELPNADVFYDLPPQDKEENLFYPGINAFENMLIDTTIFSAFPKQLDAINARMASNKWSRKYKVMDVQFDGLMQMVNLPGHKFVFIHLIAMHDPLMVDPKGDFHIYDENTHEGIDTGYIAALEYTNTRLESAVNAILAHPGPKPIIILMADHGSKTTRLQIMNALYLPGNGAAGFYPSITNVNVFRLVFDRYFGGNFPQLPDVSYALGKSLYDFKISQETAPNCK